MTKGELNNFYEQDIDFLLQDRKQFPLSVKITSRYNCTEYKNDPDVKPLVG